MSNPKSPINRMNGWRIYVGVTAGLFFLSACRTLEAPATPSLTPTPVQVSTAAPQDRLWWIAPTGQPTVSSATATQNARDAAAAQEAIETYYHLLEEKNYSEAYALLSPSQPHLQPLEEWTANQQLLINAIQLLDIQHYPNFQATVAAASDGTGSQHPLDESRWCKVFVVTIDVDYVGGWGAEPSGEDSSFVVVIKEGGEWRLAEIASGIGRDICHTVH